MIQKARSDKSRSLLRELEFALILVENDKARNRFLNNLGEVLKKRKSLDANKTGERDSKSEILAYLRQKGYVKTANVWARALDFDKKSINNLLGILQTRLMEEGVEGVLEIHLQDREINSPHIQFVGTQAEKAEVIIAQALVELKYETSIENALSKKDFVPYYSYNDKNARRGKHDDIKKQIELQKETNQRLNSGDEIQKLIDKFDKQIANLRSKLIKTQLERTEKTKAQDSFSQAIERIKANNLKTKKSLFEKRKEYRMRRRRRARR